VPTPQPLEDAPMWRKVLSGLLGGLAAIGPMVLCGAGEVFAPTHFNAGGLGGWLMHVAGAAVLGGIVLVAFGALFLAAKALRPSTWLATAAIFVAIYSPVAGWMLFDAANVALDTAPPVTHRVRFVRFEKSSKGASKTTVSSWNDTGTETIATYTGENERQAGRPMKVVVGKGALGREYVLSLTAL
jgi:hypothetical protein